MLRVVLPLAARDLDHLFRERGDVERLVRMILANATELLNAPDRLARIHGRLADDVQARDQHRIFRLIDEELGAPEDDAEVVVEVVRDAGRELAQRAQLLAPEE